MTPSRALAALAVIVGLAHLPFVAHSLEDIDSVNFALGLRDFDVAAHRPHPPGYPVYIGIGKVMAALVAALPGAGLSSEIEARALSLVSLLAALVAVYALFRLFAAMTPRRDEWPPWRTLHVPALTAAALTLTAPLTWTLTVRPMSDLPGLALALIAQACLATAWWWQAPTGEDDRRMTPEIMAASGRMIVLGALVAGLAVGLRTQTLWLTTPLLVLVLIDRIGRGVAGALIGASMTFTIGGLAWAVPLVAASGGVQGYLNALGSQAGEDFASGEMLYLNPAPRLVAFALVHTFADPWEWLPLALTVLVLAAAGIMHLLLRDRRTLAVVIALAAPYLVFHLLFQDTSFVRYALPLVPVVAWLAVQGAGSISTRAIAPVGALLSIAAVVAGTQALTGYASARSPAVQAIAAMNTESIASKPAALAMHQTFQRPLEAELVGVQPQLPSPPRREWLELAKFWLTGGEGPVWFLADPRRTDLALVDPQSRRDLQSFRWAPSDRRVFGGMRPAAVDWVRLPQPGWFAEDGWSLTPETAGMARLMGRGPHVGPITARVRRSDGPLRAIVGGRNLAGADDPAARFTLAIDGRALESWDAAPGFFLRVIELPGGTLAGNGTYAALTIASVPVSGAAAIPTSIEQFDVQPSDALLWALDEGWHEAEYTPALGVWHWTSDRSTIRIAGPFSPLHIRLRFEPPLRYFDVPSTVTVMAGAQSLATGVVGEDQTFEFDVSVDALAAADGRISIVTSQVFVPAERSGAPDRRRLGLRVFDLHVNRAGMR